MQQLLATGLVRKSYHFPLGGIGWFLSNQSQRPYLRALIQLTGQEITIESYGGPVPLRIGRRGAVEVVEYPNETAYHGSASDLIAAGICEPTHLPGEKRNTKSVYRSGGNNTPSRCSRRELDGMFVHWRETDDAVSRRVAKYDSYSPGKDDETVPDRPYDYANPEEWLELKKNWVSVAARVVAEHCSVETKAGDRYSVNPAHLQVIANHIEAIAQRICDLPVTVKRADSTPAEAPSKATAAETDGKFQSFLRSVITCAKRARGKRG